MVELSRFTSPLSATARIATQGLLLRPLMQRLVKVTILGEHRITGLQAPFIAVANHSSHLDTPLIYGALPARLAAQLATGVAGDYFFDVWWRKGLTSLTFNAFPVSRGGPSVGRWRGIAGRLVDKGVPLLIYPEGTRARTDQMGPFKPGPA
ncbi:MAG: 1-acyl-sn-glycerol-3-phosphate acyltransferase, partial [Alphaproteobacteria bacterium]